MNTARIVALHGFLGRAEDWSVVQSALEVKCPHVRFETKEIFSPNQKQKFVSIRDWAKKFNSSQKENHAERNILVGYSMGGRLALAAILDKPGLWDDVVLISSHLGLGDANERALRTQSDEQWAERFLKDPWDEVLRDWNQQKIFAESFEPQRNEKDFSRHSLAAALKAFSLGKQDFPVENIRQLKSKIHLMVGDRDTKYKQVYEKMYTDGLVEDVTLVEKAGHRVIFDQPERIAEKLVERLKLG